MLTILLDLFSQISLKWIDDCKDITRAEEYQGLLQIFPNLKTFFEEGKGRDSSEFNRTLSHIFRCLKIFSLLKEGSVTFHSTLSPISHEKLKRKIDDLSYKKENLLPLVLIYHDIGRFFDRKNHPNESYLKLSQNNLLSPYRLNETEQIIISKVIQYHLLFAAIYTGESTFYGIHSLLNDEEFQKIRLKEDSTNEFVDLLEVFTYIDVLGYPYANIYDHYLDYYEQINQILKDLLNSHQQKETILNSALQISEDWIEWRISGGLRIFQFIGTKPHLTRDFYFNKLENSIKHVKLDYIKNKDWFELKKEYLIYSCRVQIKYGLGVLILLAFGNFIRKPMEENQDVSPKLLLFWILISKEIKERSKGRENYLWNIFFTGLPHWSEWNKNMIEKLNEKNIKSIIENCTEKLNGAKEEVDLHLNFKIITI